MSWFSREVKLPTGMIDIHNHVLPGIDDGAGDWAESLAMMRAFVDAGYSVVSVSSHLHHPLFPESSAPVIRALVQAAQEQADAHSLPLRILPGCEIYYQDGLMDWLESGAYVPVGGEGGYLLIEFSTRDTLRMMKELAFQLQMKGIKPVLAHPERYEALQARPEMAREWIRAGWWMQLDLPSIIGETGVYIQRLAVQMLKEGWFHIAATDLHKSPEQADYLQQMLKKLVKLVGYEDAERLLVTNPQRLLAGKSLLEADWLED